MLCTSLHTMGAPSFQDEGCTGSGLGASTEGTQSVQGHTQTTPVTGSGPVLNNGSLTDGSQQGCAHCTGDRGALSRTPRDPDCPLCRPHGWVSAGKMETQSMSPRTGAAPSPSSWDFRVPGHVHQAPCLSHGVTLASLPLADEEPPEREAPPRSGLCRSQKRTPLPTGARTLGPYGPVGQQEGSTAGSTGVRNAMTFSNRSHPEDFLIECLRCSTRAEGCLWRRKPGPWGADLCVFLGMACITPSDITVPPQSFCNMSRITTMLRPAHLSSGTQAQSTCS